MSARMDPRSFTRNGRGVTLAALDGEFSSAGSGVDDIVHELCHLVGHVTRLRKKEKPDTRWRHANAKVFDFSGFRVSAGLANNLFSSGIRLGVTGEEIVRPNVLILALGRSVLRHTQRSGRRSRGAIPILRWIGDSPHIPVVIECHSDEKLLSILPQRQAAGDTARRASTPGQITQQHWSFKRQRLRSAQSAALRTDHQSNTLCGKRVHAVEAGHRQENLHAQSRALPGRFRSEYFHSRIRYAANTLV